jgi:hypothetical protein
MKRLKSSRHDSKYLRGNLNNGNPRGAWTLCSILNPLEQIPHLNLERLRQQQQTRQRQIHLATLKCPDLSTMEAALVGKHILGPAMLEAQFALGSKSKAHRPAINAK